MSIYVRQIQESGTLGEQSHDSEGSQVFNVVCAAANVANAM